MSSSISTPTPERLLHLVNRFNDHRNVTIASLAEELELSERTIKRYIAYMRTELGIDIVWEPTTKTYFCDKPFEYLPIMRVTGEEALSLALASKSFAAWQGSALGKALDSVLQKVSQIISGAVSVPVSEVQSFLSTPQMDLTEDREHQWFGPLLAAIRRKRELSIVYQKPNATQSETRRVWPIHLAYLDHQWALVFWDPQKEEPRKFLLNRIENVEPSGSPFIPPAAFEVHQYLRDSFGLFTGDKVFEVSIRFDSVAAPFIRERKWHPSQKIEEVGDGTILASFRVSHLMDIQRWVLSWGSHAEVLKPKKLRTHISNELKVLSKRYE